MDSNFLPNISKNWLNTAYQSGNYAELYDAVVQPLHEELYNRQTFDFLDEISDGQQLLLTYDYIRMQVGQGGFIQFIENGYIGLLPAAVTQLIGIGAAEMAMVLDDVLKVFVLNKDMLSRPKTVEEFAHLYVEFKEFEILDARYAALNEDTLHKILEYIMAHTDEFVTLIED